MLNNMLDKDQKKFSFEISLSVLNHLGRNLYRSFITVLGEAISNSWDADAKNIKIYIDKKRNNLVIKDDGIGMSKNDFQDKFLKIGYSKRKDGQTKSAKGRPYIGRKGIGKLALLSCADKITILSKTNDSSYVGGIIDNSGLDKAITDDLTPQQYLLGTLNLNNFSKYTKNHKQGTIIYFENIKDGIKNSLGYLKKTIALYFRFSLLDDSFNIFLDDKKITIQCLEELAGKTEFLWNINDHNDPYIKKMLNKVKERKSLNVDGTIKGFVASVGLPRDLKVITTDERIGVDLFVNGRLREKDILKNIPTARVVESYLYGQIHFNEMDDEVDRFTSNREGIVADDSKHKEFLDKFRKQVISVVLEDWDTWRRKHKKDGDKENQSISPKERKSEELYNVVSEEYTLPKDSKNKKNVDGWVNDLGDDAKYNFASYAECFISENLIRKYIEENKITISKEAEEESKKWKEREDDSKGKGNISIEIRKIKKDIGYLSMDDLAALVDKKDPNKEACLLRDAKEYKPIRDALAHTALLTDVAKNKLTTIYENIKGRVRTLLIGNKKYSKKVLGKKTR